MVFGGGGQVGRVEKLVRLAFWKNCYCENYNTDNRLGSRGCPQWNGIGSRMLRVGCPSR